MTRSYKYDAFISHSHQDADLAQELVAKLRQLEFQAWGGRKAKNQASEQIVVAMENSAVCILLFSHRKNSPWSDEYVWSAIIDRVKRTSGVFRLIPVLFTSLITKYSELLAKYTRTYLSRLTTTAVCFDSLDDDEALNQLILRIRGVDGTEETIWRDSCLREYVREKAKGWMRLVDNQTDPKKGIGFPEAMALKIWSQGRVIPGHCINRERYRDNLKITLTPHRQILARTQTRFGGLFRISENLSPHTKSETYPDRDSEGRVRIENILWNTNGTLGVVSGESQDREVHIGNKPLAVIGCGRTGSAVAAALLKLGVRVRLKNELSERNKYVGALLDPGYIPTFEVDGGDSNFAGTKAKPEKKIPIKLEKFSYEPVVINLVYGSKPMPKDAVCSAMTQHAKAFNQVYGRWDVGTGGSYTECARMSCFSHEHDEPLGCSNDGSFRYWLHADDDHVENRTLALWGTMFLGAKFIDDDGILGMVPLPKIGAASERDMCPTMMEYSTASTLVRCACVLLELSAIEYQTEHLLKVHAVRPLDDTGPKIQWQKFSDVSAKSDSFEESDDLEPANWTPVWQLLGLRRSPYRRD